MSVVATEPQLNFLLLLENPITLKMYFFRFSIFTLTFCVHFDSHSLLNNMPIAQKINTLNHNWSSYNSLTHDDAVIKKNKEVGSVGKIFFFAASISRMWPAVNADPLWVTNTCLNTRRKARLEAAVYPLISILFLCTERKTWRVCKTKAETSSAWKTVTAKNKKQQCTCVSKLMLTGLSERRKKLLLLPEKE